MNFLINILCCSIQSIYIIANKLLFLLKSEKYTLNQIFTNSCNTFLQGYEYLWRILEEEKGIKMMVLKG